MTTAEKLAQLQGLWIGFGDGGVVAPEMDVQADQSSEFPVVAKDGLGQLARVYGTKPVLPRKGLATLLEHQRWVAANTRLRIGILAHEECLTGLAAWTATTFPVPLASAASFDPALMWQMGHAIGQTMSRLGVHQGLAPVLDVVRDARWGRCEETMGEDPYVVATMGRAYISGLQSQGILACGKHFAGYSGSVGGRNLAPVQAGRREMEDVFLLPFEVAVKDAGLASVMPAYVEIDEVPMHSNTELLTNVLRDCWGFRGTVLADYFAIAFLQRQHGIAASPAQAAKLALMAGVDVELPSGDTLRDSKLQPLIEDDEELSQAVDRAVTRVLTQKQSLGLLDINAEIARLEALEADVPDTLDPSEHRAIAARLAEESVILLANEEELLPLADKPSLKLAVIGPNADRSAALFGCYSFVNHVLMNNPGVESKIDAPTVAEALRAEYPQAELTVAPGCDVRGDDRSGFADAVAAAERADVSIVVVGDQSGLFGRGTSGEGCDTESLELPGVQADLVDAVLATGTPVVLVSVTGRPYALGRFVDQAAAALQAFFPGEEGGAAVAGVISGRINPSGHLPVSVPRTLGILPYSYLHPVLGDANDVSSIDPTPQFSFGHGLSFTSFEQEIAIESQNVPTDSWIDVTATVRNSGARDGATVVQVYGRDVVASVTRPTRLLLAYARVELEAGQSKTVSLRIPAARFALTDRSMSRVVEPGEVQVWLGDDCDHPVTEKVSVQLTGPVAPVTADTPRLAVVMAK